MIKLQLPLTLEEIQSLHSGDQVLLSGEIYTARDAAHARIDQAIQNKEPLPFDLKNSVIYYVGPSQSAPGKIYGSCGPTSSYRMDKYAGELFALGCQGCIGKGKRDPSIKEACQKYNAIYFVTIGGLGALLQKCVKKVEYVAYADLQAEAINKLTVEDFPVYVGYDIYGGDIYE